MIVLVGLIGFCAGVLFVEAISDKNNCVCSSCRRDRWRRGDDDGPRPA